MEKVRVEIELQPRQVSFRRAIEKYPIVLYGGAKGGGKSYALRALQIIRRSEYANTVGVLFRRTYDQLNLNHIQKLWQEQPALMRNYYNKGNRVLNFPNGSKLYFRYLDRFEDVYNYQGAEFEDIAIDEITQYPEEFFDVLRSSNRTTNPHIKPRLFMGGNPGGIGHGWVKRRFVTRQFKDNENFNDYCFIPARVYDNAALLDNDPSYLANLLSLPDNLKKAYLEGDWNVFEGQYFTEWREVTADGTPYHVIEPFEIPQHWRRFISVDWGYFPGWFAALWFAVDPNTKRLFVYKELSLQRKTAYDAALAMVAYSAGDPISYVVADPSIWSRRTNISGGVEPSIAEEFTRAGVSGSKLRRGSNERIIGWMMVHKYLSENPTDGKPWLQIFNTCTKLVETLPAQVHDPLQKEDVDTESATDHWPDSLRYGCMTRPFRPKGAYIGTPSISERLRKTFTITEDGKMPNIYEDLIKDQLSGNLPESDEIIVPEYRR